MDVRSVSEIDPSAPRGTICPRCYSREIAPGPSAVFCCKECGQRFLISPPDLPPKPEFEPIGPMNRHERRRQAALARRRRS